MKEAGFQWWKGFDETKLLNNNKITPPSSSSSSSSNNFSENSHEFRLSELLFKLIKKRNSNHKQPNLQTWSKYIDYMIRIDRRKVDEIRSVIFWCQQDDFWADNILSTQKLRKQFDQLVLKMKKHGAFHEPEPEKKTAPKKCGTCYEFYREGGCFDLKPEDDACERHHVDPNAMARFINHNKGEAK